MSAGTFCFSWKETVSKLFQNCSETVFFSFISLCGQFNRQVWNKTDASDIRNCPDRLRTSSVDGICRATLLYPFESLRFTSELRAEGSLLSRRMSSFKYLLFLTEWRVHSVSVLSPHYRYVIYCHLQLLCRSLTLAHLETLYTPSDLVIYLQKKRTGWPEK